MHQLTKFKELLSSLFTNFSQRLYKSPNRTLIFFFTSVAVIVLIKYFQFPILTYNAEVFGESGNNFFYHAYEHGIVTNLQTLDAGYLPLAQRLIAMVLVMVFHVVEFYPYVSQAIAVFLIAVFSSLINFDAFKKLASPALRFSIGITLGLISDFELNVYMNFIYFGAFLLFLGIFINKEKLSKLLLIILTTITAIIILSKGQFIVFIPIYFIMTFLQFRKKHYKSALYFFVVLLAGVLQFGIITTNVPANSQSLNLLLLPYFFIKSIYYWILTYNHVFFGYILKEGTKLLSIGLLFILFAVALKTIIKRRDYFTLSFFVIGNFIAICSLFLTILLYGQTNPNVAAITQTATKTTSVVAATEKITNQVYDNASKTKSIFDDKHHANARGLFISNALIFLTGIIVLLRLFPRKRDSFLFLLLIFLTSGAFGQIRAEEMYNNKNTSYSQWATYYPLLNNESYCIPINNYPFIIKNNCDYLLMSKYEVTKSPPTKVQKIALFDITPHAKGWEIQAVALINKPSTSSANTRYTLTAYDSNNKAVGQAKQLVPGNNDYLYYLFDKPVSGANILIWKTPDGKEVKVSPTILIYGVDKKVPGRKVEY